MTSITISAVANHLWQSTLFALTAGLLTVAFRKNNARVRYCLWLAASIKFLIPFSLLIGLGAHYARITGPSGDFITAPQWSLVITEVSVPFPMQAAAKASAAHALTLATLVFAVVPLLWLTGTLCIAFVWVRRWTRIRKIVRAGFPVELGLPVRTISTADYPEPAVFGIIRPVLLLPRGITERLTAPELQAIVIHELCHVRWRDNAAAVVHMLVEALCWFHPLVWWIGSRLVDEREGACDEEVVRISGDPRTYAESLVKVCEYYLESRIACVAGVTGSNLKKRVKAIMTDRAGRALGLSRKLLLAAAVVATIATPMTIGLASAFRLSAQAQPSGPRPAFDVASVKATKADLLDVNSHLPTLNVESGRNLNFYSIPLKDLIMLAYGVGAAQVAGLPSSLNRFDVIAQIPPGTPKEQIPVMLQTLLAERFRLMLHHERKSIPVYALAIGNAGSSLRESPQGDSSEPGCTRSYSQNPESPFAAICHRIAAAGLAQAMQTMAPNYFDRPVVDMTGLKGVYDITLQWIAYSESMNGNTGPTIFAAVQRLGLKMEALKRPMDILVVDHCEMMPTEN